MAQRAATGVPYGPATVGGRARLKAHAGSYTGGGPLAYAGQGKLTRAFAFLDRAIQVRDIFMPEDFFDPLLDPLRADPRFARIEKRMGITRQSHPRP